MIRRLAIKLLLLNALCIGAFGFYAPVVHAQVTEGLNAVGETVRLPSTDPRVIAGRVINVTLGLLGIILVSLILYAGYLYMTSEGEADKTTRAKAILKNAVIGLVIILSAWAITSFIINSLINAALGPGGGGPGGGGPGGGFVGGGASATFRVDSIVPSGNTPIRNVEVVVLFTRSVDPTTASAIVVQETSSGSNVPGTIAVSGPLVTFTPNDACPAPNADRKCFKENTDYTVRVGATVKSTSGTPVSCVRAGSCQGAFKTGSLVDTQPPTVRMSFPTDGMSVSQNFRQDVLSDVTDDAGVKLAQFFDGQTDIGIDAVPSGKPAPLSYNARIGWDTWGVSLGLHTLSSLAKDIDTNTARSNSISVVVRPEHCFNQTQDTNVGETGIDCGGDPQSQEYCGACLGGACTKNSDCASGVCQAGVCVAKPLVYAVSPLDGKPGTFVTLQGVNFGATVGEVIFLGNPNDTSDDRVAIAPAACTNSGMSTWSNYQAIVEVPAGAAKGPIRLKNSTSALWDRTDDDNGPKIVDFEPNNASYPGICGIKPDNGIVGTPVELVGAGFGSAPAQVLFGPESIITTFSPWTDTSIKFTVPVVDNGPFDVAALVGTAQSNLVSFRVVEKGVLQAPVLDEISPAEGPQQQYITLYGRNFGYEVGTVIFSHVLSGVEAVGSTDFPPECSTAFWTNTNITVKVPTVFKDNKPTEPGAYKVKVVRRDAAETNQRDFKIVAGTPSPGVCAIVPSLGPENTLVTLYGERFGSARPAVTFTKNVLAQLTTFQDRRVDTSVPRGAITGRVGLKTGAGQDSNTVGFQVKNCNDEPLSCGPVNLKKCCPTGQCVDATASCIAASLTAEYGWNASTGLIPASPRVVEECTPGSSPPVMPSPSPWLNRTGGDTAPVNSVITIRFDRKLDPVSVKETAFTLSTCTASVTDPCATKTLVEPPPIMTWGGDNQQDYVTLTPKEYLLPNTLYAVTVSSDIKAAGAGGAKMEIMKSCGTGVGGVTYGYCFRFKTRTSSEVAQIGEVNVLPDPYHMENIGDSVGYDAVPLAADDRCIVLNCSKFGWEWYTGIDKFTQDARALITNNAQDGKVLCRQKGTGLQETVQVPVDINAKVIQSVPIPPGKASLYVNFVPPRVEDYGPNCEAACSNALIWARFSGAMSQQSATNLDNVIVQKCKNENCDESELAAPIVLEGLNLSQVPGGSAGDVRERFLGISPKANLDAGAYYRVLLKGGAAVPSGITGLNGVPLSGLNHPQGFAWKFRVKQGADAFCVPDRIDVSPLEKYENASYASQLFMMTPYGAPDECSANGQMLVTDGGTSWTTSKPEVAALYKVADQLLDTGAPLQKGCSNNCLATGATGQNGLTSVCGNNLVETTDKNYCKVRTGGTSPTTPRGTACKLMDAGAAAGEQCEPSKDGLDICNPQTCLFTPVASVTTGGSCGNGVLEANKGEMCDFGSFCHYASDVKLEAQTIAEGKPCEAAVDGPMRVQCKAAGGICQPLAYRGCTSACLHAGAAAGQSTCGNNDVAGDGKDCDDGNRTDGDGCSSMCLHEGSRPAEQVPSICGNGKIEPGETCDATTVGGVIPAGCDPKRCIHLGNIGCNKPTDRACCGNGVLDTGEDCEDGNTTSYDGCGRTCLFEGSSAAYRDVNGRDVFAPAPSFCSDGVLGTGEQCESGRSSDQVAAIINYAARYAASAVVGSDMNVLRKTTAEVLQSIRGGEPTGDGDIDPIQLAYIEGDTTKIQRLTGSPLRVLDPDNRASSIIGAIYATKLGNATYGIQCGMRDESQCPAGMGLDTNGCCSQRPAVVFQYPTGENVCRNVLISASFNVGMDAGSVVNNFQLLSEAPSSGCPAGSKEVLIAKVYNPGFGGVVRRAWDTLVQWVTSKPALAQLWCSGTVTGQLRPHVRYAADGKTPAPPREFSFRLDQALAPSTKYRVRFLVDGSRDDNYDVNNRVGIKSAAGVVAIDSQSWWFVTGPEICKVNAVNIVDTTDEPPLEAHPYLFLNKGGPETRSFRATPQSLRDGIAQSLSPIPNVYDWEWAAWTENSRGALLNLVPGQDPLKFTEDAAFIAKAGTDGGADVSAINGTVIIAANVRITADQSVPSTKGRVVQGVKDVTVMTCSNPWPSLSEAPFRDASFTESYKLQMFRATPTQTSQDLFDLFLGTPNAYYNFSTVYCRDAGSATTTKDDLPQMSINPVPPNPVDRAAGILRQVLLTFGDDHPELKKDGIGLRILSNPNHLSPERWYMSRGFSGNPSSVFVDEYPAVQDGTSVYVAAANRPSDVGGGPIYSNIYLISHNEGAEQVTREIYDQMVAFLSFNINMKNQSNVCIEPISGGDGVPYVDGAGRTIPCSADWECLKFNKEYKCDSLKSKLARDTIRLSDFQKMAQTIEASKVIDEKNPSGTYPRIEAGTYLRNVTTSAWPSWKNELASAVKLASMPIDPVNKLMSCGRCFKTQFPCQTTNDCNKADKDDVCQGGMPSASGWVSNPKIDPVTCWNSGSRQFICPKLSAENPDSVSRIYQYQMTAGGFQYQIGAEFEVPPPGGVADQNNWWYPSLPSSYKQCATPATLGKACKEDADCLVCADPKNCKVCSVTNVQCTRNSDCRLANELCIDAVPVPKSCKDTGAMFSYSGICRDILISSEAGVCGDGVVNQPTEVCELKETRTAACQTKIPVNGKEVIVNGHQRQTCLGCTGFAPDPKFPQCQPDAVCGNGKIDGTCSNNEAVGCSTDANCGGGTCVKELCDDGVLNGSYGKCAKDCRGFAAYCGDEKLSPGEVCDEGSKNGAYSIAYNPLGCSSDCRTSAPYCGNGNVEVGIEQCELGGTERTQKAVCRYDDAGIVTTGAPCTVAADCPAGPGNVTCGGTTDTNSCVGVTINGRATQHVRECSNQCNFTGVNWSQCVEVGTCGDGVQDPGEACDDGPANGVTKRCTDECKKNICGDGKPYQGVEECDNGTDNGKATCAAPYGSSCLACSNQCKFSASAGGYCGDAIKNGPEQCDDKQGVYDPNTPCVPSLGYSAATDPACAPDGTGKYFRRLTCGEVGFDTGKLVCGKASCRFEGCAMCEDKVGKGRIDGQVFDSLYNDQPVPRARVTLLFRGVKVDQTAADDNGRFAFVGLNDDATCSVYKIVVDSYDDNACTNVRNMGRPDPTKCDGKAWPTVRGNIDESANNGYWPFTSQTFSGNQESFVKKGLRIDAADPLKSNKIYITPRSGPFQTTVIIRWDNSNPLPSYIDAHLYVPKGMAFTKGSAYACSRSNKPCIPGTIDNQTNGCTDTRGGTDTCIRVPTYQQCTGKVGENCQRDVYWRSPGLFDLSKRPFSSLFCAADVVSPPSSPLSTGACVPATCAERGATCGTISDGCGGSLTCGTCTQDAMCGGVVGSVRKENICVGSYMAEVPNMDGFTSSPKAPPAIGNVVVDANGDVARGASACDNLSTMPRTLKFTRKYASSGQFSFYMDDYNQYYTTAGRSYNAIKLSVEASTYNEIVKFEPTAGQCAKAWNVFTEDVATGNIYSPTKPWVGVRRLPADLMIGSLYCRTPGVFCDNPGYAISPPLAAYSGGPSQEYTRCDQPANERIDSDGDKIFNGIDMCPDVACPVGDTLCKDESIKNLPYYGCPHPDPDGDGIWGDTTYGGPDQCPNLSRWDGCTKVKVAAVSGSAAAETLQYPDICQMREPPLTGEPTGCPAFDADGDNIPDRPDPRFPNQLLDKCPDEPGSAYVEGSWVTRDKERNGCPITINNGTVWGKRADCPNIIPENHWGIGCCASYNPTNPGSTCVPLGKCTYNFKNNTGIPTWEGYKRGYDICYSGDVHTNQSVWGSFVPTWEGGNKGIIALAGGSSAPYRSYSIKQAKGILDEMVLGPGEVRKNSPWDDAGFARYYDMNAIGSTPLATVKMALSCDQAFGPKSFTYYEYQKGEYSQSDAGILSGLPQNNTCAAAANNTSFVPKNADGSYTLKLTNESWIDHFAGWEGWPSWQDGVQNTKYFDYADLKWKTAPSYNPITDIFEIGSITYKPFDERKARDECSYQPLKAQLPKGYPAAAISGGPEAEPKFPAWDLSSPCKEVKPGRAELTCAACHLPGTPEYRVSDVKAKWCGVEGNAYKCDAVFSLSAGVMVRTLTIKHEFRVEYCDFVMRQMQLLNDGPEYKFVEWYNGVTKSSLGALSKDALCVQEAPKSP